MNCQAFYKYFDLIDLFKQDTFTVVGTDPTLELFVKVISAVPSFVTG
jgi:hypothetical protein